MTAVPPPPPNRLHTAATLAGSEAHLIVTWPAGASCADIEEAIKGAAREAIIGARQRTEQRR